MKKRIDVMLFLACLWLFFGCNRREPPQEKPPTPVRTQIVAKYSGESSARYSANIRPSLQVELAFRVPGYIQEILHVQGSDGEKRIVQEGDRVKAGSVLARIRDNDYRAKADQARSQLAEARALQEQARLDFERAENLFRLRSLTKQDYDAARARYKAAEARVSGARAILDEAEITLKDTILRSPIDGVVLKRSLEVGSLAGQGTTAFILADTASMKAVFGVSDTALQELKLDTPIMVAADAVPGGSFEGRITRISPSADPASRIFEVEVKIPNPDNTMKVGMIASVFPPSPKPALDAPVIPLGAIIRPKAGLGDYGVFVVNEEGGKSVARMRPVQLGEAAGSMMVVTGGLTAGERIIAPGAQFIHDGETVRIIP